MNNRNLFFAVLVWISFLMPFSVNAANKEPLMHNPNLFREQQMQIDPKTINAWLKSERDATIQLPWFDNTSLAVEINEITLEEVDDMGKFTMLSGTVEAEFIGNVILTVGEDVLTGAIIIDTDLYRLRSKGNNIYSLVEVNQNNLPEHDCVVTYSDDAIDRPKPNEFELSDEIKDKTGLRNFKTIFEDHGGLTEKAELVEDGSRIDIMIAYTSDSKDWAERNGLNMFAEIVNMIAVTNELFAQNFITTRFHLVGAVKIDHTVLDPKLKLDLEHLQDGNLNFQILHDLRDLLKVDLISLLVLNGEQGCNKNDGTICGLAYLPPDHMSSGINHPSSPVVWDTKFASNGFSVVSVYNAFNGYTFLHEMGHNLGAGHDGWMYYLGSIDPVNKQSPTADAFARGWVMFNENLRTVMAYNDLCEDFNFGHCERLPFFSNPWAFYGNTRLGHPAPGQQPQWPGPANNVMAINRMAQTVANYRQKF